jgi:ABC-type branched-subunit amino acid transport system substrate-binding protein
MNIMSQNNMDFNALGENWQYAYTFYNAAPAQFAAALQYVKDTYPDATKVVYACDDNGSNAEQAALVESVCQELGLEYVDAPVVFDAESTDFSAVALQIMQSGADVFIGNGDVTNTGSILKEIRNNGSDMVCAGVLGANASMMADAAGMNDLSRAFTMGSDLDNPEHNTDIFNEVYNLFKEEYGEDTASSWCGASINNMYVLLQLMQGAGSVDVDEVRAYYDTLTTVETLFGTGTIGGQETFGCNHVVANPNPISVLVDGEVQYGGTVECIVP